MLSKFSVKRPYTVVVGVVLIIILGVVSFGNMTLDLLPSMNLPYAIVMTTYTGASPEEVEEVVTKPVEQTMAAVLAEALFLDWILIIFMQEFHQNSLLQLPHSTQKTTITIKY